MKTNITMVYILIRIIKLTMKMTIIIMIPTIIIITIMEIIIVYSKEKL